MNLVTASGNPLIGEVEVPGDKSISHRGALFAALSKGVSVIDNFLVAGVTVTMLHALTSLGIDWELSADRLTLESGGMYSWTEPINPLDCRNSATTMRLLAGALAAAGTAAVLDGSPGLRRRPMNRIIAPLQMMAVPITASTSGKAPLRIDARSPEHPLQAIDYAMPVASAQVKTTLILAALAADSATTIREPGPSRDHTERMLASMGAKISSTTKVDRPIISISPLNSGSLTPLNIKIPGDFSTASFLIVAALITPGSAITLRNVGLNPTRTGLLDVLLDMGAEINITNRIDHHSEPTGDLTIHHSQLHGIEVSGSLVVRMIDEFPIFAIAAACADGQTTVCDAVELRHKESDRIAVLCKNLSVLGVDVQENPDGFTIDGRSGFSGGTLQAHGDHRMAMAFAVAGLVADTPMTISGAEIISESYPGFIDVLSSLGASIDTRPQNL